MQVRKGFTLIELLVVISIIGLLAAAGLAVFSSAQKRARDAKRKSDIHALEQAIQMYYTEHNSYPDNATTGSGDWPAAFKAQLAPYMDTIPIDPQKNQFGVRYYGAYRMTWAQATVGDPSCDGSYVVWMYLENTSSQGQYNCGWADNHFFKKLGNY